jgi:hypothetical protein
MLRWVGCVVWSDGLDWGWLVVSRVEACSSWGGIERLVDDWTARACVAVVGSQKSLNSRMRSTMRV